MGSFMVPPIGNIFAAFYEKQFLLPKLYCYVRYVDDTFALFSSHSEANKLFLH